MRTLFSVTTGAHGGDANSLGYLIASPSSHGMAELLGQSPGTAVGREGKRRSGVPSLDGYWLRAHSCTCFDIQSFIWVQGSDEYAE